MNRARLHLPAPIPFLLLLTLAVSGVDDVQADDDHDLVRLPYNHEGLVVDLGVGLWA